MLINLSGIKLNVETFHPSKKEPVLVMLHGFTGSGADWEEVIGLSGDGLTYVTVDLIGHGKSESPLSLEYYNADAISGQLHELIKIFTNRKVALLGYSMGGRAALTFATRFPEMIDALILESTTPGITNDSARLERRISDEKLADFIESHPLEDFVNMWMNQELFKSQKKLEKGKLDQLHMSKLKNNPVGLANILRGFGTGVMPPLFDMLYVIKCPVLLVTGELDAKFTEINSKVRQSIVMSEHVVIENAGHNTHLEKPEEFSKIVKAFLINRLLK